MGNFIFVYPSVLRAVSGVGDLVTGRKVHGMVIKSGLESDAVIRTSLLCMYGELYCLGDAQKVPSEGLEMFHRMLSKQIRPDKITLLSVAEGCARVGCLRLESQVEPNAVTMINALYSCARLGRLKEGKSVHCFILRKAMDLGDLDLGPALVEFYVAFWEPSSCHKLLNITENIVSWNILISFYARAGLHENTMIHGHAMKRCFMDEFVQNSLIDMYLKCGFADLAYLVFDKITEKSIVTWNCMISGLSQNGFSVAALKLFDQMYFSCLKIDEVTFLCAIQACSNLGYDERISASKEFHK
ncbi:Putative pentatricopeptide repeat-containing protein [Arachis hypogaea]|nr:Putative pentatricopeptide repeat-containing protein [Arachis hypogaea]